MSMTVGTKVVGLLVIGLVGLACLLRCVLATRFRAETYPLGMDVYNHRSLNCSAIGYVLVVYALLIYFWGFQPGVRSTDRADYYFGTLLSSVGGAIPLSLFLIAIPYRIALNLLVASRRRPYRIETVVLLITFVALAGMFYTYLTVDWRQLSDYG